MSMGKLTTTPGWSLGERAKKLLDKFEPMRSGDQILVAVANPVIIKAVLKQLEMQALIRKTHDRAVRDDGVSVPVYLVTFT